MTRVYLSSPTTQAQASVCAGQHVLISYAVHASRKTLVRDYSPSFKSVLVDSGAFSELNSGVKVDLAAYVDWVAKMPWVDNWAALDDISGDWRRGMENLKAGGFGTYHEADPPELLPELIEIARERGNWIGLGMTPPRRARRWLVETLERIPEDLHIHGWALGAFLGERGASKIASVDSTTWYRRSEALRVGGLSFLTPVEALSIEIKRILRTPKRHTLVDHEDSLNFEFKEED